jgi:hypothetical protein
VLNLGRLMARFHDEPVVLRAYALVHREWNLHSLATAAFFPALAEEVGAFRRPGFGTFSELGDAVVDLTKERLIPGLALEPFRDGHSTLLARVTLIRW